MLIMSAVQEKTSVRLVHARHENNAVAMADGYARMTGRVGVASVTAGPGVTNIATSLVVAVKHRTPLVVIAGDIPQNADYHGQKFEQGSFVRSTGAISLAIINPETALRTLREAFFVAQQRLLPVVVSVPANVLVAEWGETWAYQPSSASLPKPQRVQPDPTMVDEIANVVQKAKRPVIIAGRGAADSGAHDSLVRLGDRIGALLGTTLRGKGFFRTDEFNIGIIGSLGTKAARDLIAGSDCIVGVGASLGHYTAEDERAFAGATVIQIDSEPQGFHQGRYVADHYLVGDALASVDAVNAVLESRGFTSSGYRTPEIDATLASVESPPDYEESELEEGFVHPAHVMRELNKVLTSHHHVVVGGGAFWTYPGADLIALGPEGYNFEADFMAISQALSMAIGAASADDDRRIIAIEGDGSALMNIQELDSIAVGKVPVLFIVINDGAYGAEVHGLAGAGHPGEIARFRRVDFAAVAEAFGVRGHRLANAAEIGTIVKEFDETRESIVVDVPMSTKVISSRIRRTKYGQDV